LGNEDANYCATTTAVGQGDEYLASPRAFLLSLPIVVARWCAKFLFRSLWGLAPASTRTRYSSPTVAPPHGSLMDLRRCTLSPGRAQPRRGAACAPILQCHHQPQALSTHPSTFRNRPNVSFWYVSECLPTLLLVFWRRNMFPRPLLVVHGCPGHFVPRYVRWPPNHPAG
jgi:hypothetical protein